jgi:hypothetical protein
MSVGFRCRVARAVISADLADVLPRCSIDASMSALRREKARRIAFGMSRSSPRPLRRTCQARPRGRSSARSADWFRVPEAFCHR